MNTGNALAIVTAAKNKGALVFANIENMEANVELYRTEVTEITFAATDFHTINGKKMPNRAATDRIGEAKGIQFIQSACRVITEIRDDQQCGKRTVYRAEAQGKIRMPDGSWRESTVDEYEFDPVLRAMLDKNVNELTPQTKPTVARTIMEYTKVARQRAATGARLRVIRQLTDIPTAFEPADALKPMVFTRIVQNTSYILNTEAGRFMATAQALGMDMSALYGKKMLEQQQPPQSNISHTEDSFVNVTEEAQTSSEPDFPDEPTNTEEDEIKKQIDERGFIIDQLMASYKDALDVTSGNGKNPYKMAQDELANQDATIESRDSMIKRLNDWLKNKGIKV